MDVYYHGKRFSGEERTKGIPVNIGTEFSYGGYRWYVPALYSCPEGIVIDVLRQIPNTEVDAFLETWESVAMQYEGREDQMPEELRLLAERDNPYEFPVKFSVEFDGQRGTELQWSGNGYGSRYPAGEVKLVFEEYGCDLNAAWYLYRISCGWPGGGSRRLNGSLPQLTLSVGTYKAELPCSCRFRTNPGCAPMDIRFLHPSTGEEGIVRILSCEQENIDWSEHQRRFGRPEEELVYPEHFLRLNYQVSLEGDFRIKDTVQGDSVIRKERTVLKSGGDRECAGAAVGIIGGTRGPITAGVIGKDKNTREKTAFSSMHFHPVEEAEWILTVHEKLFEPIEVVLT